jgi:hypothetical protein
MNEMQRERLKTVLYWTVCSLILVPLAAALGGFAGWCLGASLGSWIQELGWSDAAGTLGRIAAYAGTAWGGLYFVYRLSSRGASSGTSPPEADEATH